MDNLQSLNGQNEIVIKDLEKNFGDVKAVNGLNLEIKKGEMFGFLGPNGAGKSTTINILCGLLAPTAGTVLYGPYDIKKDMQKIKERIGVCPQESAAFKFLSGRENLELFGTLHGLKKNIVRERAEKLIDQANLFEAAGRKVKGYSGGMMRQLNLMMALISHPDIVFLDEPTVGHGCQGPQNDLGIYRLTQGTGKNGHPNHALYRRSPGTQ